MRILFDKKKLLSALDTSFKDIASQNDIPEGNITEDDIDVCFQDIPDEYKTNDRKIPRYTMIPNFMRWIILQSDKWKKPRKLNSTELEVYGFIYGFNVENKICFTTQRAMSDFLDVKPDTVKMAISTLSEFGLIEKHQPSEEDKENAIKSGYYLKTLGKSGSNDNKFGWIYTAKFPVIVYRPNSENTSFETPLSKKPRYENNPVIKKTPLSKPPLTPLSESPHIYNIIDNNIKMAFPDGNPVSGNTETEPETPEKKRNDYPTEFERVWKMYPHVPKRSDKVKSLKLWNKLSTKDKEMLERGIDYFRDSPDWTLNNGRGVPAFERYINQGKWKTIEDDTEVSPSVQTEQGEDTDNWMKDYDLL